VEGLKTLRDAIEGSEEEEMIYAEWGDLIIIAVEEGTEEADRLDRIGELLGNYASQELKLGKEIRHMKREFCSKMWSQVAVNLIWKKSRDEEIMKKTIQGETYAIAVHTIKGIEIPPDEIELRRREKIKTWDPKSLEKDDIWEFQNYDGWMIAITGHRRRGNWNKYDRIVMEMGDTVIGPMTAEFGEGNIIPHTRGLDIIQRIDENGKLKESDGQIFFDFDETWGTTAIG
jgi:hypothetical protein